MGVQKNAKGRDSLEDKQRINEGENTEMFGTLNFGRVRAQSTI
jgi:hypothetical protein